jgi:PAP2 superfamily
VSRRDGLAQIALVLALVAAYELARRLITPDWTLAVRHARDLLAWERGAGIAWEVPVQRFFLRSNVAVVGLGALYAGAHFVVTGVFFVWLYRRSREAYRRFRDGFLLATVAALVVQWRVPVAPPRLAGVGIEDTLRRFLHIDIGSPGSPALTDPVAALPSLHAGWAVGVGIGLLLHARSRVWRAVGAVYPLAVVLATVVTGNHFLVDTIAGFAVMGLGFGAERVLRLAQGGTLAAATRGGAVR